MALTEVASIFKPGLFDGKIAIVTGGGTGIGLAITKELLHLGCKVMIASRKLDRLTASFEKMQSSLAPGFKDNLRMQQCNIRKEEEVKQLIANTISTFGGLDYLVNNGGGQFKSSLEDIRSKGWHAVIETNLYGTFYCCQQAYKQWMKDHGGVIINMLADIWKGTPTMGHSGAARAGVHNLTKTMSLEWAPSGVRVNAIAPGSSIYSETASANYGNVDTFGMMVPTIPAKRLGKTEEISAAVCFLLSPAAAFITGHSLIVDGGQSLYMSPAYPIPDHNRFPTFSWEEELKKTKSKSKL